MVHALVRITREEGVQALYGGYVCLLVLAPSSLLCGLRRDYHCLSIVKNCSGSGLQPHIFTHFTLVGEFEE